MCHLADGGIVGRLVDIFVVAFSLFEEFAEMAPCGYFGDWGLRWARKEL